jgi:hypothetical protein
MRLQPTQLIELGNLKPMLTSLEQQAHALQAFGEEFNQPFRQLFCLA